MEVGTVALSVMTCSKSQGAAWGYICCMSQPTYATCAEISLLFGPWMYHKPQDMQTWLPRHKCLLTRSTGSVPPCCCLSCHKVPLLHSCCSTSKHSRYTPRQDQELENKSHAARVLLLCHCFYRTHMPFGQEGRKCWPRPWPNHSDHSAAA